MNEHDATEVAYKNGYQAGVKEFADGLVTMFLNSNESLSCEDIVENIKRFLNEMTEGRENDFKEELI